MSIGVSHPHAFFIANFSATLCFEEDAHGSVSGPSGRWHTIQGSAERIAIVGVLRVTWGVGDVTCDLVIVVITRQKVTLDERLADVNVIREHVMLSGESQQKAKTAGVKHRTKAVLKVAPSQRYPSFACDDKRHG